MAYPAHALVQFGGTIASSVGTPEIWACGVRVVGDASTGGFLGDPATALANLIVPLKNWYTLSSTGMDPRAQLTFAKVNNIGPDGKYADQVVHTATISQAPGNGVVSNIPAFLSVAMTWETGVSRGLAHRGRVFPPNATYLVTDDAHIADADRAKVVNAGIGLLQAISTGVAQAPTFKMVPAVVSSRGAWHRITGVSADNIYDVQRRRKNRLASTRSPITAF